jgi:signal transduction histidine kinase
MGVLVSVFAIESVIMVVLSWVLPADHGGLLVSFVDAALLTATVAPILWWFIIRPLKALLDLRTHHLAELFSLIEEERRHVAMELHDGVGQYLTMLVSGLRTVGQTDDMPDVRRRCLELQQASQEALAEVRRITLGLRPSLLDDLGLAPAVTRLADDMSHHHGIVLAVHTDSVQGRLPAAVETSAFRIVQEALNNVVKHSRARSALVKLAVRNDRLIVSVEDDGCGLPRALRGRWNVKTGHLGLLGMRERAVLLGGELTIRSAPPGRGTRLVATIPLGARHAAQEKGHAR